MRLPYRGRSVRLTAEVAQVQYQRIPSRSGGNLETDGWLTRQLCGWVMPLSGELVDDLLAASDDPNRWFTRLLTEPATPSQIRSWTAGRRRAAIRACPRGTTTSAGSHARSGTGPDRTVREVRRVNAILFGHPLPG